jgi:hypothetical protein
MTTFAAGSVIRARTRLWRVDGQDGDVLAATSIDGGEAEQVRFYVPFEDVRPGRLRPPSADVVGRRGPGRRICRRRICSSEE